jgi:hypothetical protein
MELSTMSHIALGSTLGLLGWTAFCFLRAYIRPLFSPLRVIPGPDKPHWLYGHFGRIISDTNTGDTEQKWMAQFGHVFKFKAFFSVRLPNLPRSLPSTVPIT